VAMALDKNIVSENTIYNATKPLKEGKYIIHDYKPQKRPLKVSECILYSSNICFAQIGKDLGEKNIKEYSTKMKLFYKAEIEIPEVGKPLFPSIWRKTNLMTFSYGHGIAISPLQFVNAFSSIINGGNFRYATLIKEKYLNYNNNNDKVISEKTSHRIRKLLREVVSNKEGSGNKAEVPGYFVAGKTGTAIKNKYHRYEKNKNLTSFVGFFPSYNPEFLIFIMVDEPKPIKETNNYVTGGWVAAPTVKKIISEMAPKLGIIPKEKFKENLQKHVSLKNN
jgi:cell division protein FtsI (penicillin-binding protein 3)